MDTVATQVAARQLSYLTHVARYPDTRLERTALGLLLDPESYAKRLPYTTQRTTTLKAQLWERLGEMRVALVHLLGGGAVLTDADEVLTAADLGTPEEWR